MRNLIVKYLALSYRVRLFGKEFAFVRAANVIVPLMLLLGYALITNENYPKMNVWTGIALLTVLLVFFIEIVYFRLFPVKWKECDVEQKWFFGNAAISGQTKARLSEKQYQQWVAINKEVYNDKRKFVNIGAFAVIPLCLVVFLIVIFKN